MKANLSIKTPKWSSWVVVPLRLFLGVTFVYAGFQKLADPQYFNPAARGYIGKQIANFAHGSPLHDFLLQVAAPHAAFFGALVAYGELAIGLGTLLGLLLRPAAFFGLVTNMIFFLSADWHVYPYFYGSDLVFLVGWLTLLIAGPTFQILPALDTWLVMHLVTRAHPQKQPRLATLYTWLFGVKIGPVMYLRPPAAPMTSQFLLGHQTWQPAQTLQPDRRNFIWGIATGSTAMLALAWLVGTLRGRGGDLNAQVTPTLGSPVTGGTPATNNPGPGSVIAKINDVPTNSALSFTLPSSDDPGILIHLNNGQFVAYDAICTHAGCPVDYDAASGQLICPCHGAAFDPGKSAAVLNGPAQTPLTSVPIKVNRSTGTISLG